MKHAGKGYVLEEEEKYINKRNDIKGSKSTKMDLCIDESNSAKIQLSANFTMKELNKRFCFFPLSLCYLINNK